MSNSRFALRVLDYETYLVYLIVANRQFFCSMHCLTIKMLWCQIFWLIFC